MKLLSRSVVCFLFAVVPLSEALAQSKETDDADPSLPPGVELRSFEITGNTFSIDGAAFNIQGGSATVSGQASALEGAKKDLEGAGVKVSENEHEIILELSADVLFDFDKATIKPSAASALSKVAELLANYEGKAISLGGHTDSKGSDDYNNKLSRRRADSVKSFLTSKGGISGRLITTSGYGERNPIAPNEKPDGSDDPEGRQRNRRVEIKVAK